MNIRRLFIWLSCSIFISNGCTYEKGIPPYSEYCGTSFSGFPEIPGWKFSFIPIDVDIENARQPYFFAENKGLVFTYYNIWLTEDEGIHWKKVFYDAQLYVSDVMFIDPLHGYVAARAINKYCILETKDGGHKWKTVVTQNQEFIKNICFVDSLLGFASIYHDDNNPDLEGFYIGRTHDGGLSWEKIPEWNEPAFSSPTVKINQDGFGYILGDNKFIQVTNDFGENWSTVQTGMYIRDIQFLDKNIGFAGDYSAIYKTEDGGNSWTVISENGSDWFHFFSVSDAISRQIVGYYLEPPPADVIQTCEAFFSLHEGNANWDEGPVSTSISLYDVNFINDHLGYGQTYANDYRIVKLFR